MSDKPISYNERKKCRKLTEFGFSDPDEEAKDNNNETI